MAGKQYDFGGWATKNDLLCADGRVIRKDAFKHNDQLKVPLAWHHGGKSDPDNILGHAILENRDEGVYAYCSFNNTPRALKTKELIRHGDIESLSIYANDLVEELTEKVRNVVQGNIREVSLVMAGANPGAFIDDIAFAHDIDSDDHIDEAVIYTGESLELSHSDDSKTKTELEHYGVPGMKRGVRNDKSADSSADAGAGGGDDEEGPLEELGGLVDDAFDDLKKGLTGASDEVSKAVTGAFKSLVDGINTIMTQTKWTQRTGRTVDVDKSDSKGFNEALRRGDTVTIRGSDKKARHSAIQELIENSLTHEDPEKRIVLETEHGEIDVLEVYHSLTDEQKTIYSTLMMDALNPDELQHDLQSEMADIYNTMTDEQKLVLHTIVGLALETDEDTATDDQTEDVKHSTEGAEVANVFDKEDEKIVTGTTLSHDDMVGIISQGRKVGSLREAVEGYALQHGINNIDILFPDAKDVTATPDFVKRRTEWVSVVMDGTRHTPFSRIRSKTADLTLDEARAKGYVKGTRKREEFFAVAKRETTPQTVYKKQKLHRDDVLDITDFDVIVWLKAEMRIMLDEEIARAILIGDGRSNASDDKISESHIRPILTDDELFVTTILVQLADANSSYEEVVDALTLNRKHYRGSGNPTFFCSETVLAHMLLIKDTIGRRIYPTPNDLAAALRVKSIVAVEVMEEESDLIGILVNLSDYTVGSDKGGSIAFFDDFDIDYNLQKYLIETRLSGALVKAKSALVVKKAGAGLVLVVPTVPTFDPEENEISIPTDANVVYRNKANGSTLTQGSTVAVTSGNSPYTVIATPAAGKYFETNADDEWTFVLVEDEE